jgi:hypothetical protein
MVGFIFVASGSVARVRVVFRIVSGVFESGFGLVAFADIGGDQDGFPLSRE